MQTLPNGWEALFNEPSHRTEYKLVIAGVTYGMDRIIGNPTLEKPLMEKPVIGRCCSGTLSVVLRPYENQPIPKSAECKFYARLASADGATVTDWLPQGVFYISQRSVKGTVSLTMRDGMLKGGATYLPETNSESFLETFPKSQREAAAEIAARMGTTLDSRSFIMEGADYIVGELKDDTLMTEVLQWIAVANGGNWIMTEEGKLRLIPLASPEAVPLQELQATYKTHTDTGDPVIIRKVSITDGDKETFVEGDSNGHEIYSECPYITDGITKDLKNKLYGVKYVPYSATVAYLNPALELGDTVSMLTDNGTVNVALHSIKVNCTQYYSCEIESGRENETEDEYPYLTARELAERRAVRTDSTYFGNSISRKYGFRSQMENGAYAQFNALGIEFVDEKGDKCLYYDTQKRTFIIVGTLGADAIVTDSLYADGGIVAELTVDELTTSKRIKLYLAKDLSDDNYIFIHEHSIEMITASVTSGTFLDGEGNPKEYAKGERTVHAVNRNGEELYWLSDISQAELVDGLPVVNGVRVLMTTEVTDYPVMTYEYAALIKSEYSFDIDQTTGFATPFISFGAGNQEENSKGRIWKHGSGFRLEYLDINAKTNCIEFNDNGIFIGYEDNLYPLLPILSVTETDYENGNYTAEDGVVLAVVEDY